MANERKTETLVRDKLRALGYNQPDNGVTVEEQKSEIAKVKTLLSKASKNAKGNAGYPEFIISNRKDTAFLIVFECKPDVKKHESPARDKPVEYAVDGALHYAKHLAKKRARQGYTFEEAYDKMYERNYFGMMMVETVEADAFITGL